MSWSGLRVPVIADGLGRGILTKLRADSARAPQLLRALPVLTNLEVNR
ncbi:hypothetical protein ACFWXK_33390 [Streptomyces sp. NPDC059070]